jgi:NAD-dependent dihydropyrimidine dehydrogenase PreA subunit
MSEDVYKKLAKVLDTLPNGFPETGSGVEQKLLRKVFSPEEAELFCEMKLDFETAEQVAARTGRDKAFVEKMLEQMYEHGQLFRVDFGTAKVYKMLPWVFGIYEFQLNRMDREFAELCEEYGLHYAPQFFGNKPQLMQVVPVEKEISASHETLPYHSVSNIIEKGLSFAVAQCICKKEQNLLDNPCNRPQEVCLGIAPVPNVFDNHMWGRPITKEAAYKVLEIAEEAALVHLTWNIQNGHYFICNCCGCCCGVLRSITELGINGAVNSHYYAKIDADVCSACGVCADERCQVHAISEQGDFYEVDAERCIGCGLCISTCPTEAITLVKRERIELPPSNEDAWFEERGKARGVDYSDYLLSAKSR